jgi:hypothetical protein
MARKSKITAVPIAPEASFGRNQPEGLVVAQMTEEEPKTDAQEMTEVINEVNAVAPEASLGKEPQAPEEPVAPEASLGTEAVAEPKAKPKRASRAKASSRTPSVKALSALTPADQGEPVVNVTPTLDEATVEVELPPSGVLGTKEANKEAKSVEKVTCPDCGKQMSAKTLKYSHKPNCVIEKKQRRSEFAEVAHTAKQIAEEAGGELNPAASQIIDIFSALEQIPDEVLDQHVLKKRVSTRAAHKQQALEKLVAGAF